MDSDAGSLVHSILAVDIGTVNTRVVFIDVVNGSYRFVGGSIAASTVQPPYSDATEGMRHAVAALQRMTGRTFIDSDNTLLVPSDDRGLGADVFGVTASAGRPLKLVLAALMPDVSLESLHRVADTVYVNVVDTLALGDRRTQAQRIEVLLKHRPDVILLAGGTSGGAEVAVRQMLETIQLACMMLAPTERPAIIYAGNEALHPDIGERFKEIATVTLAPNARPRLDVENLAPARQTLHAVVNTIREIRVPGFGNLADASGGSPASTASATADILRYLAASRGKRHAVLGIDVGATTTAVTLAVGGDWASHTCTGLGVGEGALTLVDKATVREISHWLPTAASPDAVTEFLLNKSLVPQSVPEDEADLHFEHALAREVMRRALAESAARWSPPLAAVMEGSQMRVDTIVAAGAVLTRAPSAGQAGLMLADALQPAGLTEIIFDRYALLPALGVTARENPLAVVQLLESPDIQPGLTLISVMGRGAANRLAVRVSLQFPDGRKRTDAVHFGDVYYAEAPATGSVQVVVKAALGVDLGLARGQSQHRMTLVPGSSRLLIDARGRPLSLPRRDEPRISALTRWLDTVRGQPVA